MKNEQRTNGYKAKGIDLVLVLKHYRISLLLAGAQSTGGGIGADNAKIWITMQRAYNSRFANNKRANERTNNCNQKRRKLTHNRAAHCQFFIYSMCEWAYCCSQNEDREKTHNFFSQQFVVQDQLQLCERLHNECVFLECISFTTAGQWIW